MLNTAGARAVDLGGPKFEIKHKSRCLQKKKLVNWEGQTCRLGGQAPSGQRWRKISKMGGPKPMTRFSSPATRAGSGVARNFVRGGIFEADWGNKKSSMGVRGHALLENFWKIYKL